MESAERPSAWRFSTDGLPETERFALFSRRGRPLAHRVEFSPAEGRALKWAVDIRIFEDLIVVSAETSRIRAAQ
jgi:hypothetical protein